MSRSLHSDELFPDRPALRGVDDESLYERLPIESAVEPVGDGSQVMPCVLAVLQQLKSTAQGGLRVIEHDGAAREGHGVQHSVRGLQLTGPPAHRPTGPQSEPG